MRRAFSLTLFLALVIGLAAGCAGNKAVTKEPAPEKTTTAEANGTAPEGEKAQPSGTEQPGGMEKPSGEQGAEGGAEKPAEEQGAAGGGAKPAEEPKEQPKEEPKEEQPPAEKPAEKPAEPTQEELQQAIQAQGERAQALAKQLADLAEQSYKAGDLAKARDLYEKVLLLQPSNDKARDRYNRILEEMGERAPVAKEVLTQQRAAQEARREQMKVEIQKRLAMARESEAAGDFDKAISYYEEILNLLQWYPYQADFPITSTATRARIAEDRQRASIAKTRLREKESERIQVQEERRRAAQREQEMHQMRIFITLANGAYDHGEYDLAIANARKVLALDPRNQQAQDLIRIAQDTKYTADRREIQAQFSDQWKKVMEQLEYTALPHPEILDYPANWSEISQRQPPNTGSAMAAGPDERTQQIMNSLAAQRVYNIDFKENEVTLEGAVSYLRSVTGENFVLSQKVREEKGDTPIPSLKLDNVSVKQVLDLLTTQMDLAWVIRNGVVMVLDKGEAVAKPVTQFYDVKDLIIKISDFPTKDINLVPSKYQPPEQLTSDNEPTQPFDIDNLKDVIQQTIAPESWSSIEGAGIESKNGVLIVKTTPEIHRRIAQFLSDLRRYTGLLVSMEVRFLTAEDRFLRDVGVDIRGLGDQTGGVGLPGLGGGTNFDDSFRGSTANPSGAPTGVKTEPSSIGTSPTPGIYYSDGHEGEYKGRVENLFDFIMGFNQPGQAIASAQAGGAAGANSGGFTLQHTFLDDTQLEVILRAVEKSARIEQISAPRLTVYDAQRANVSILTQNSYVGDFDVEIAQAAAIGDPIVETIRDGVMLDVRPVISADRRFITMELRPTVADLVRPIPTFQTSLATGPPVTIQVPEISISRVRTTVTMPDGGTLLLGGIKFFRDANAESGVPILNKVPILSFLFNRKAKTVQRRNLLILIRAQVVILEEQAPDLGIH